MTPYTTPAGLQIGRCYIPPPIPVRGDAVVIQKVLLAKPKYVSTLADKAVTWALWLGAVAAILAGVLT